MNKRANYGIRFFQMTDRASNNEINIPVKFMIFKPMDANEY